LEGPTARIRIAQLLPYGARIDLKLSVQMDCPLAALLQFAAETGPLGGPPAEPAQQLEDR
jgi:hypothetical protein